MAEASNVRITYWCFKWDLDREDPPLRRANRLEAGRLMTG